MPPESQGSTEPSEEFLARIRHVLSMFNPDEETIKVYGDLAHRFLQLPAEQQPRVSGIAREQFQKSCGDHIQILMLLFTQQHNVVHEQALEADVTDRPGSHQEPATDLPQAHASGGEEPATEVIIYLFRFDSY